MNYVIKNTIEGVHHEFKEESNNLFVLLKTGGIKRVNEDLEPIWVTLGPKLFDLRIKNPLITAKDVNGEFFIFSKDNGHLLSSINDANSYVTSVNEFCFIFDRVTKITTLFDVNTNKQEWQSEFRIGFPVFSNEKIMASCHYLNKQCFDVLSINTGALLWHFDVSALGRYREWEPGGPEHPGEVRKFIGVWEGLLLVALTNYTIIALEVETGRLLHTWRYIPGFEPGWMPSAIPKPERMVLDDAGGKLVALWSRYFWEIDLRSGDIQMHDLSADFGTPRDLVQYLVQGGSNPALLGDKHLIAFAERYHSTQDGYDAEIIAFNRQTLQIDWRHTFPIGSGVQFGVNNPIIEGNRLYALDIGGTLHIFEREE